MPKICSNSLAKSNNLPQFKAIRSKLDKLLAELKNVEKVFKSKLRKALNSRKSFDVQRPSFQMDQKRLQDMFVGFGREMSDKLTVFVQMNLNELDQEIGSMTDTLRKIESMERDVKQILRGVFNYNTAKRILTAGTTLNRVQPPPDSKLASFSLKSLVIIVDPATKKLSIESKNN